MSSTEIRRVDAGERQILAEIREMLRFLLAFFIQGDIELTLADPTSIAVECQ